MRVAIGCRDHSGWAILVAVGGEPASTSRSSCAERVVLVDDRLPRMAYHAALDVEIERAGRPSSPKSNERPRDGAVTSLDGCERSCTTTATRSSGIAIAAGTAAVPDDLAKILASHTLVHAAEGELYREALVAAAEDSRPAGHAVRQQAGHQRSRTTLRVDADTLAQRLGDLRKPLGPPWQKDHREATAAALLVLHQ